MSGVLTSLGRTLLLPVSLLLRLLPIGARWGRRPATTRALDQSLLWRALEERRVAERPQLWQRIEARRAERKRQPVVEQAAPVVRTLRVQGSRRRLVRVVVPVAAVVSLAAVVGAVAFFTATGSGFGSATAGSADPVTISAGTPTSFLYPGGQSDVTVTIDNPNDVAVKIPSLGLDTDHPTDHSGLEGDLCTIAQADLTFTASALTLDNGGSGWTVPANDSITIDLADAVEMGTNAANGCQNATFTVYLKVSP